MDHQQRHWLEKLLVQFVAGAAVVAVYFGLWPMVRSGNFHEPAALLATGNFAGLMAVLAALAALSVLCAAATVTLRPEGALMSIALGAAGVSLRSPRIQSLLWSSPGKPGSVLGPMVLELLILGASVVGVVWLVAKVRQRLARMRSKWVWDDPLANAIEAGGDEKAGENRIMRWVARLNTALTPGRDGLDGMTSFTGPEERSPQRLASCLAAALAISVVLLALLLRSPERGQVLFAVIASFALGVLVAHQTLPALCGPLVWALPVVAGLGCYVLAWLHAGALAADWSLWPYWARILPVDWFAAGGGGALLGYWLSARVHEVRHFEDHKSGQVA